MKERVFALTGTSSSGKTTLFDALRDSGLQATFVEEAARKYYQEHNVPKELRGTYENHLNIQALYLQELEEAMTQGKDVISDSSLLSGLAYGMERSSPKILEKIKQDVEERLDLYTLFLLLNPDDINYLFDPSDPIRKETPEQRLQVHQNLVELLIHYGLPYEEISGNIEARVETVLKLIASR